VGIEIDERTCEVAAVRLSQETLDFSELDIIPTQMALLPGVPERGIPWGENYLAFRPDTNCEVL